MIVRGNLVYEVQTFATGCRVEELFDNVRHVEVTTSDSEIASNGVDVAIITIRVFDYMGNLITQPLIIPIDIEGTISNVTTSAGYATLEITSDHSGPIRIRSQSTDMRNGEVEIYAF